MLRIHRTFCVCARSFVHYKGNIPTTLAYTKQAEQSFQSSTKWLTKLHFSSTSHTPWKESKEHYPDSEVLRENENDFGSLAQKHDVAVFKLSIDQVLPEEDVSAVRNRKSNNTPTWYFLQCRKLARKKKVLECVQFLEERMLKQDRVKPLEFNFTVVIGALGRIGYVKKAFKLYNEMKDRALTPSVATYTALFNAVANSPYRTDIRKAMQLYGELHKKKIRLNRIIYNSAIKAFGVHGSLEQMMKIFGESIAAGFEPDSASFDMIFHALSKNKETGFRHAIEVWRQMIMLGVEPSGKTLLYFLKVMKSCGIGDLDMANRKLIEELPDPATYKDFFKKHMRNVYWLKGQESFPKNINEDADARDTLTLVGTEHFLENEHKVSPAQNEYENNESEKMISDYPSLPNSRSNMDVEDKKEIKNDASVEIRRKEDTGNLLTLPFIKDHNRSIKIAASHFPWHRLQLVGGHRYIFDLMRQYNIEPTNMVLSTLVQCSQPQTAVEDEIMDYAENSNVELDSDFYNMILHKRAKRLHQKDLKKALMRMANNGLSPNYRTWCIMALSCVEGKDGIALLKEIKRQEVSVDNVLFNSLICAAVKNKTATEIVGYEGIYGYDYRYLVWLIYQMRELGIKADVFMIKALEQASNWPEGYKRWDIADVNFEKKVFHFRKVYKKWLEEVELEHEQEPFKEFQKKIENTK